MSSWEVSRFLETLARWARTQPDVRAVAATAADDASDFVDVVLLTTAPERYAATRWLDDLGRVTASSYDDLGDIRAVRAELADGLTVEFGIARPEWAETMPGDGLGSQIEVLHDLDGLFAGRTASNR